MLPRIATRLRTARNYSINSRRNYGSSRKNHNHNHNHDRNRNRKCRVIVCGVGGRMGAIRTDLVYANPRFELCGVCDTDRDAVEAVADAYSTLAFGDLESALDRFRLETNSGTTGDSHSHSHSHSKQTTLDGVLVATPTPSHGDCIRTAAAHGLGIFVEKPVAESPAEISELYAVCENSGDESSSVPLCCGFQRRFDASYANAARLLREKTIGTVSSARVVFGDSPGPSLDFLVEGGNIFSDLCVHDVDFLRWALGSGNDGGGEIEIVFACGSSSREELAERNIQDHATMVLTTKGGTVATIALHRFSAYGYDQRCEFFGSTGNIEIGNPSETTTKWSGFDGGRSSRLLHSFDTRFRDAFANEVDAFADALLGVAEWPVTRDDVIRVQQVAEAAKRSLETNAVVRLEPPLASSSSSSSSS